MARTVKNGKIDTPSARSKFAIRPEPYWTVLSRGAALGYRRGLKGGSWVARLRDDAGRQHYEALGAADDVRNADGLTVYSFAQAQALARDFFDRCTRELAGDDAPLAGPYTVKMALDDYFTKRRQSGSKGIESDESAARARILPELGEVEVARLTTPRLRKWLAALAASPRFVRSNKALSERSTRAFDVDDEDAVRARRATANRVLTVLKAALNLAFRERVGLRDDAWRKVDPFQSVDEAIIRYLSEDECRRLVNACSPDFRKLVQGALTTGARYGELIRLRVDAFDRSAGTITIRTSKSGKSRRIHLADEGRDLFEALTVGRAGTELIFKRADGKAWGPSHQQRPLEVACKAARIEPAATFHILRHTYASALVTADTPMAVIAAQLGHRDTRMTEKHYAHLKPDYVAKTIQEKLPRLAGFTADATVTSIAGRVRA